MKNQFTHDVFNPLGLETNLSNLSFRDNALELDFIKDYQSKSVALVIVFVSLSAFLYGCFYLINPPGNGLWFATMTIIALFIGVTIYFKIIQRFFYAALMFYSLVVGGGYIMTMPSLNDTDLLSISTNFMGLTLIVCGLNSFIRLKFIYSVITNILIFLLYVVYGSLIVPLPQKDPSYFNFTVLILFSTIVINSVSTYHIEYVYRNNFNQRKKIQKQADELKEVNEGMEIKVIQRTKELEQERVKSLKAIIEGQEIERQRIAQDLHDSLNIRLIGLKRSLEPLLMNQNHDCLVEVDSIINQVREISHNLSPYSLKHLGLVKAIEDLCSRLEREHKFTINFQKVDIDDQKRWNPSVEIELFRVIQELTANIIKHAQASIINIELISDDDMLYLSIEDNGIGFDYAKCSSKGIGLNNINARVKLLDGSISYDTQPGHGTTVMINLPIQI